MRTIVAKRAADAIPPKIIEKRCKASILALALVSNMMAKLVK